MRRVGTVGILLVAISSFLALQAICRPFVLCIERTCEIGGELTTSLMACVAPEPTGACGMDEVDDMDDMDCRGRHAATGSPRSCMLNDDLAPTKSCCESQDLPAERESCPRRVMSCVYCIPARFIWEPAPLDAVRQSDGVNRPATLATVAMTEADQASRLAHAHAPPGIRLAEAGFDRRIAICSFLL